MSDTFDFWRPVSRPRSERYERISGHPEYDWSDWRDTETGKQNWIPNIEVKRLGLEAAFNKTWEFPRKEEQDA